MIITDLNTLYTELSVMTSLEYGPTFPDMNISLYPEVGDKMQCKFISTQLEYQQNKICQM